MSKVEMTGEWCVLLVTIMERVDGGVTSDAVFGPFPSNEYAGEWLDAHRDDFGPYSWAPSIQPLWRVAVTGSSA